MTNGSDLHNLHLLQGLFEGLLSSQMRNNLWVVRFGFSVWAFNVRLCYCNLHYRALRSLSKFGPGCPQIHIIVMAFWSQWSFATTLQKVKKSKSGHRDLHAYLGKHDPSWRWRISLQYSSNSATIATMYASPHRKDVSCRGCITHEKVCSLISKTETDRHQPKYVKDSPRNKCNLLYTFTWTGLRVYLWAVQVMGMTTVPTMS